MHNSATILKTTELSTLNESIVWYVNYNSTKLLQNYINNRQSLGTNSEKADMELAEKV